MTLDATSPRRTRAVAGVAAAKTKKALGARPKVRARCPGTQPLPRTRDVTEALEPRGGGIDQDSGGRRRPKEQRRALARLLATASATLSPCLALASQCQTANRGEACVVAAAMAARRAPLLSLSRAGRSIRATSLGTDRSPHPWMDASVTAEVASSSTRSAT